VLAVASGADALLVTYAKITGEMIKQMPKCRIISRFGIGVDNVDLEAASASKIVVTKVPDYCIDEVSTTRWRCCSPPCGRFRWGTDQVHAGTWKMPNFVPIHRLRGSVLGLAGFGRIPQLVAPKAQAFGMRSSPTTRTCRRRSSDKRGVEQVDFATLLNRSDYVSMHSPLTPETKGLFNADAFRQMKKGAYIVNTARGPDHRRGGAGGGDRLGPHRGRRLDVMSDGAAGELAAHRQAERDHHAAHQLLLGRVARGAADEGGTGSRRVLRARRRAIRSTDLKADFHFHFERHV
jgi:D-3-phosphoglycerate dehydrogenase